MLDYAQVRQLGGVFERVTVEIRNAPCFMLMPDSHCYANHTSNA